MNNFCMKKVKTTALIILDGWGIAPPGPGNAVSLAKTPTMSELWKNFPHTELIAHGKKVGLPGNQEGNSEAGHMNLSSGFIVKQDAVYINDSIEDGTFFKNNAFAEAIRHAKKYKSKVHLMGLLSNGESAHSFPTHLYSLLDLLHQNKVEDVFIHLFTDGRDSGRFASIKLLSKLRMHFHGNEKIVSIMGRFYAMDRVKNWKRTESAYNAMVLGEGLIAESAEAAISIAYNRGETDEFILPTVVSKDHGATSKIDDNDAIIFFNLRSDRARELTKVLTQENFNGKNGGSFKRKKILKNICFVAMTDFGPDLPGVITAFPSRDIENSLPSCLKDKRQIYIAETEKYAHVTYFFNGGYADPIFGEERVRIPSPNIFRYEDKPEMSAPEITKNVESFIRSGVYDFITVNFCNPDMIGHTGNLKAGIKAVNVVDICLKKIIKEIFRNEGVAVVTADHGNIEGMINLKTGEIDTEHSTNPVPFIVAGENFKNKKIKKGILADVAPTTLDIMDLPKPKTMTRRSLFK